MGAASLEPGIRNCFLPIPVAESVCSRLRRGFLSFPPSLFSCFSYVYSVRVLQLLISVRVRRRRRQPTLPLWEICYSVRSEKEKKIVRARVALVQ